MEGHEIKLIAAPHFMTTYRKHCLKIWILQLRPSILQHAKEAVWIKKFINDLGIILSIVDPIELLSDNNGTIAQANLDLTNGPNIYALSSHSRNHG